MKKVIFALLAMFMISAAHADTYAIASVGHGNKGAIQTLGVGTKVNDWLAVEGDIRNFGSTTDVGGAIGLGYVDPITHACVGCRTEYSTMKSHMTGVALSVKVSLSQYVYTRAGLMYRNIKTDEVYAPSLGLAPSSTTSHGLTPIMGIGLTAYGFAIEETAYMAIYPTPDGKQSVNATSVSYKLDF